MPRALSIPAAAPSAGRIFVGLVNGGHGSTCDGPITGKRLRALPRGRAAPWDYLLEDALGQEVAPMRNVPEGGKRGPGPGLALRAGDAGRRW